VTGRYEIAGREGEFEPGSDGTVLRNLKGIANAERMREEESQTLIVATNRLLDGLYPDQRFTAADICYIHRFWLGDVYAWAGAYRSVNLSKGDFTFASASFVPQLMVEYQDGPLARYTPSRSLTRHELEVALAVTHSELVLIHPFRDGNGRCARVLSILMAVQVGMPALDFEPIELDTSRYIGAIHAAVSTNYEPMTALFGDVITRTIDRAGGIA